jgi:hypothetical protein
LEQIKSRADLVSDPTAKWVQQNRQRYAKLVDKKFAVGLTEKEEVEQQQLAEALDEADKAFYQPIKDALAKEIERLRTTQYYHSLLSFAARSTPETPKNQMISKTKTGSPKPAPFPKLTDPQWRALNRLRGQLIDERIANTLDPERAALLEALQLIADAHLATKFPCEQAAIQIDHAQAPKELLLDWLKTVQWGHNGAFAEVHRARCPHCHAKSLPGVWHPQPGSDNAPDPATIVHLDNCVVGRTQKAVREE